MFKRVFVFLCVLSLMTAWPLSTFAATRSAKLINFFLDPELTAKDLQALARWDVVVLDFEQQWLHPNLIRQLKQQNPNIKILAHISSSEILRQRFTADKRSLSYQLASGIDPRWFVLRTNGVRAEWWPNAQLLDPTDGMPRSKSGERWNTYLPKFIKTKLMSSGLWDGVFLDAAYGYVTGHFGSNLDFNRDGKPESDDQTNQRFFEGMTKLIQNVRKDIGEDKLIINNSGERYAWLTNGVLFENVPQYGWTNPFNLSREMARQNQAPVLTSINTNTQNREEPYNYQAMRLGLATALVADIYYSFDAGDAGHHRTWWYDEYNVDLGAPINEPVLLQTVSSTRAEKNVWGRAYTKGFVIANPTDQPVDIKLDRLYQRLNGIQDPITNNAQISQTFRVWPQDGLVLQTPVPAEVK